MRLRAAHPKGAKARLGELAKMCGSAWKNMSKRDRQKYLEKAEKDKKRYQREVEIEAQLNGGVRLQHQTKQASI